MPGHSLLDHRDPPEAPPGWKQTGLFSLANQGQMLNHEQHYPGLLGIWFYDRAIKRGLWDWDLSRLVSLLVMYVDC